MLYFCLNSAICNWVFVFGDIVVDDFVSGVFVMQGVCCTDQCFVGTIEINTTGTLPLDKLLIFFLKANLTPVGWG
jgi:hypothetical protein